MLPSCFLSSVFFVVPWCGAWHVARLCPEKARKGPPVWTVVVLGECLEEVAGCPSHFPTWQPCVEEDTRGALSGGWCEKEHFPCDRDGGVSWCLPCWGAISTAPQTPSLLLLCLEPELWPLAEEKCKARGPQLALGSEQQPPRPPFRCPRCRVLRRLTEFREFSRLFLSLLSRCLLLSSLAF